MRVILFDLDDTLFDHKYCSRAALIAIQKRYEGRVSGSIENLDATYQELLELWHKKILDGLVSIDESRLERFRILLSNDGNVATDEEAWAAAQYFRDSYDTAYRAVPGAIDLLRRIGAKHPIGIVTNHVVAEQVKKVDLIGIEPFVDALIISEEVGVSKPAPKIFEKALSQLGGTPNEAVMIGDSWASDILGATNLGIRSIWLNRYNTPCPDSKLATEIHSLEPTDKVIELILNPS